MYVRFFVPEEYYCRPFNIIPRPYYGTTTSSWSTKVAFPSFSTLSGWRDVRFPFIFIFFLSFFLSFYLFICLFIYSHFPTLLQGGNSRTFGFGQNSILVCPNTTLHPEYNVGTYSGLIYALTATSFEIDIAMSPMVFSSFFLLLFSSLLFSNPQKNKQNNRNIPSHRHQLPFPVMMSLKKS